MTASDPVWFLESRVVAETEFDLWLREIVLLGLYFSLCFTVTGALAALWRKQTSPAQYLLRTVVPTATATATATTTSASAPTSSWPPSTGTIGVVPTLQLDGMEEGTPAPPTSAAAASADDADDVDVASLPFLFAVLSLSMAVATACAVPLTLCVATQLDLSRSDWLHKERLLNTLWEVLVKGSNACLVVALPFAYFFYEADTRHAGIRGFLQRLVAALLEVTAVAIIVLGILTLLQRLLIDRGSSFAYPSTAISTAQLLPGMLLLMFAAPVGALQLTLTLTSRALGLRSGNNRDALQEAIDSDGLELAALHRRLSRLVQLNADQWRPAPLSPGLQDTEEPAGVGNATDGDDVPSVSFEAFLRQRRRRAASADTGSTAARRRRGRSTSTARGSAGGHPSCGAPPPAPLSRRRDCTATATTTTTAAAGPLAGLNPRFATANELRSVRAAVATVQTRLDTNSSALASQFPAAPSRMKQAGWAALLVLVVAVLTCGVLRVVSRPILGFVLGPPEAYGYVDCLLDVTIILFYTLCCVYGVFIKSNLVPLPLYRLRPVFRGTPLLLLLANAVLLLLLSFTLPVIVWVLGIGSDSSMSMIAGHYGYIAVLHSPAARTTYVLALIAVCVWLVFVRAKQQVDGMMRARRRSATCE